MRIWLKSSMLPSVSACFRSSSFAFCKASAFCCSSVAIAFSASTRSACDNADSALEASRVRLPISARFSASALAPDSAIEKKQKIVNPALPRKKISTTEFIITLLTDSIDNSAGVLRNQFFIFKFFSLRFITF